MKTKKEVEVWMCKPKFTAKCWQKLTELLRHAIQPRTTTRHGSQVGTELWYWTTGPLVLVITLRYEYMSLYCLELQCIWKNVCIFSLVGSLTQKFYPEDGNCREGVGGPGRPWPGCAAELCIGLHCAVSSKALEFWNFGNMFLNSFTTNNLYKKKNLKIA